MVVLYLYGRAGRLTAQNGGCRPGQVRGLADLNMHSGRWTLAEAMAFCVSHAPHGELLDGSHHLWYELDTTLRGVGHHMLMILGKTQLMRLFRTRVAQLGAEAFVLRDFMVRGHAAYICRYARVYSRS